MEDNPFTLVGLDDHLKTPGTGGDHIPALAKQIQRLKGLKTELRRDVSHISEIEHANLARKLGCLSEARTFLGWLSRKLKINRFR